MKTQQNSNSSRIRAKAFADHVGLPYSTIDYWAEKGLLQFERADGRTRVLDLRENMLRCQFILRMQKKSEGYSLDNIKAMIRAGEHRKGLRSLSKASSSSTTS